MEGVESLPADCLRSIFNHLNDGDLKAVSLVCKDFLTNSNLTKRNLKVLHPKVSMLSAHLKRFTEIKKIDLSEFYGDIDEAILEIAQSGIRLEALDISSIKAIRTETLKELGSSSNMKNLKVLNFHPVDYYLDFLVIANSFPNLQELTIGYNYYGDINQFPIDYGVQFLASKLKLLRKISFSGKPVISDKCLLAFSLSCLLLKDVTILCNSGMCNTSVTESGIALLLRIMPNLEALSIGFIEMNSSTITIENSISHAKALTSLDFTHMDVSDMLLNAIAMANLPLKKFKLTICKLRFTAASLLMVLANYQLTELSITGLYSRIVGQDMNNLLLNGDISKLTHIEISPWVLTKPTLLLLAAKCPSLESIRICYITDRHQQVLDESVFLLPNIRVLDLRFWYNITSKDIKSILKTCKFLRKLILIEYKGAKLIEADDSQLPEVNLEDLTVSRSWIGDEVLAQIAKICPRLVSLDLSYSCNFTAEGIKQIVRNITTLNCLNMIDSNYCYGNQGDLLESMLSTGDLGSLKKVYVGRRCEFGRKQKDEFLQHGCLLLQE